MHTRPLIQVVASSLLFVALQSVSFAEPVTEKWVARYDGPALSADAGLAIAVTADGSVLVTGRSIGTVTWLDYDYATIKYSPAGAEQWAKRYNGPGAYDDDASAIVLDPNGNIFVTGWSSQSDSAYSEYDFATIGYNSNGDTSWTSRYDGLPGIGPGSDDFPMALGLSADGYLYATGRSKKESDPYPLMATIKYSATTGAVIWVKYLNGTAAGQDAAQDLAVDAASNVYVTGYTQNTTTGRDVTTIKYSATGDTLWVRQYDGPASGLDEATAIKLDAQGNVYVAGNSQGLGGSRDFVTIKYSPSGDTLWVRLYAGPALGYDAAVALGVDGMGSVLVTGQSNEAGGSSDYATIKYSASGDTEWVRRYNGPGDYIDIPQALGIDSDGNVYVTGGSTGASGHHDYLTIKYSPAGDSLWTRRYDGPSAGVDIAHALTVDACGTVYVTGESRGTGPTYDMATIKYQLDSDGDDYADLCDQCLALATPGNVALVTGDVNADGPIASSDIIYLVNYVFKGGVAPLPVAGVGDANCSQSVNSSDVIALVNYVFKSGASPCDVCAL